MNISIGTNSITVSGEDFSYTFPIPVESVRPVEESHVITFSPKHNVVVLLSNVDFESGCFYRVIYEPITLKIGLCFIGGEDTIYWYEGVSLLTLIQFIHADSLNSFWREYFKDKHSDIGSFKEYTANS